MVPNSSSIPTPHGAFSSPSEGPAHEAFSPCASPGRVGVGGLMPHPSLGTCLASGLSQTGLVNSGTQMGGGSWDYAHPRVHVFCPMVSFTEEDIKVQRRQDTLLRPHSSGHGTLAGHRCAPVGPFKARETPTASSSPLSSTAEDPRARTALASEPGHCVLGGGGGSSLGRKASFRTGPVSSVGEPASKL